MVAIEFVEMRMLAAGRIEDKPELAPKHRFNVRELLD
jgi:hypothetical protein